MCYEIAIENAGQLAERIEPYIAGEYETFRAARRAIATARRRLNLPRHLMFDIVREDGKRYQGF